MTTRLGQREAGVLLPLTAGLILLAVSRVTPDGAAGVLSLITLFGLGALVPDRPWRTGAIAASPTVAAAVLVAAVEGSTGSAVLFVVGSPLLFAFAGLLVKGGALLVARDAVSGDPGHVEHRWRPFETKAQRGRFLVIVATIVMVGSVWISNWGSAQVDRAAAVRIEQIRSSLAGRTPESIRIQGVIGAAAGGPELPGGPYRGAGLGKDRFTATAEVSKGLQSRCIHVVLDAAGQVSTRLTNGRCGG